METRGCQFPNLKGPCFDSLPYELADTGHPIFSLFSFLRPDIIQILKWRFRYATGLKKDPYAKSRKDLLFIPVPKNASQSILQCLHGEKFNVGHFSAQFFKRINSRAFELALKVAIVRNPNDRFSSAINYNKHISHISYDIEFGKKYLNYQSIDELISAINQDDTLFERVTNHTHFRRQVGYLCDSNGRLIINLLISMDALDSGIDEISRYTGQHYKLNHVNRSRNNNSSRLYGRLRDFYDADFRLWDLVNQHKSGYVWVNEPKLL